MIYSADSHDFEHFIDITNSSTKHPGLHTFTEDETVTFGCRWPGSVTGFVFYYLVYVNDNIVLNSSGEASLTHTIYTSCQNSGRYACGRGHEQGGMTTSDAEVDLLVSDCNPRMCAYKDNNRNVTASLGSDVHLTLCVLTTLNSTNYPTLKYTSRYVTTLSLGDKMRFNFTSQPAVHHNINTTSLTSMSPMYHNLTITVYNVTLEDYGTIVLFLNTSATKSMKCYFSIHPKEPFTRLFNFNTSTQILTCLSSWFPRNISISKRYSGLNGGNSGQTLSTVTNTELRNSTLVNRTPLPRGTCLDMGTYECKVTDFKDNSVVLDEFVHIPNCPPRLCDSHLEASTITVKLRSPASLRVCIMGVTDPRPQNMSVALRRNDTYVRGSRYRTETDDRTKFHLYLTIILSDISEDDEGEYTADVAAPSSKLKLSSVFNVVIEKPPVLCNNSFNDTTTEVRSGQSLTAIFCIQTSGSVVEVKVNSKPMVISKTQGVRRSDTVFMNLSEPGSVHIHVNVPNITVHNAMTYVVSVRTGLNYVLLYRFHLNLTGNLTVCDGVTDKQVVNVRLGSTAVAHLCVMSDLGLNSHIGVNNQSYVINKYNSHKDKLGVTAHRKTNSTEHFIQIYIQNITTDDILEYTVLIKPTLHIHLALTVQLELINDKYPHLCKGSKQQLYRHAQTGGNVTLRVCVVTSETVKGYRTVSVIRGNGHSTANFSIDSSSSHVVNSSRGRGGAEIEHVISLHILNVTSDSFTRYDVLMNFDTHVPWRHTFYLINFEDADTCPLEICYVHQAHYQHYNPFGSLCLPSYGEIDNRIQVNGVDYQVSEDAVDSGRHPWEGAGEYADDLRVYNAWSHVTTQRCVILDLDRSSRDSFTVYNVTLAASGLTYSFRTVQTEVSGQTLTPQTKSSIAQVKSKEDISVGASTSNQGGSFVSEVTSAQIPLVMISVILSMMSFLLFSLLVCYFVLRGKKRPRSTSRTPRKDSEATVSSRRIAADVSKYLNTTMTSQDTERSLLSADDFRVRERAARDNSADYSTLSGIYITPIEPTGAKPE
ncbi:hypothetical protein Btru_023846 [Bulinus truncatus]|nr:hypothetical protein Btru_023846 [Bulinus truncatus]